MLFLAHECCMSLTIACITIITRDVFAQGGRIIDEKKERKKNMITTRKEKQSL